MELRKNEKTDKNLVELEIAVTKEEFEPAMEKSYRKNVKNINVAGFRKGKAPRKMIEKIYGSGVFYDDAINYTYGEAYDAAVAQAGLEPVAQPEVEILDISDDGYTFKAKVTVKPEVKLGQYKGLSAYKGKAEVSDEEVAAELDRMAMKVARTVGVDRPIQTGDTAKIDFEGFVDGVPFEGGKGEGFDLTIGSGQFIPGFEEQLVGHAVGEDVEVAVTFPEQYHAEELKGKAAVFQCKIHEVNETVKPELNDEFAKDVSEFDTLDALKADIREKQLKAKEESEKGQFEERVIDKMLEGMEVDLPPVMVEQQAERLINDFSQRLAMQGLSIDGYMSMNNMDIEGLKKIFMPQAERQVKVRLALDEVSKLEKIEISDADVEAELAKMAEQYKMDVEKIKSYFTNDAIRADLKVNRTVDLIRDSAIALDEEPKKEAAGEAEKPKTKKRTSKKAAEDVEKAAE